MRLCPVRLYGTQQAFISEAGKYLRVVTEPDGQTVHNAFLDRRFKP